MIDRKPGDQCCDCNELLEDEIEVETGRCFICAAEAAGAPRYYRTMLTGRDRPVRRS